MCLSCLYYRCPPWSWSLGLLSLCIASTNPQNQMLSVTGWSFCLGYLHYIQPSSRAQGKLQKRGWKEWKGRKTGCDLAEPCLLDMAWLLYPWIQSNYGCLTRLWWAICILCEGVLLCNKKLNSQYVGRRFRWDFCREKGRRGDNQKVEELPMKHGGSQTYRMKER